MATDIDALREELAEAKGLLRALSWVDWRMDVNRGMVDYGHQLTKVERLQVQLNRALKEEG
ncbi:hypothetical protein [Synechococcus sp. CC9605]|uniref:hypothetical protein n=1 Tax=Synechococcus sp. (strain CC9605) TaxID=110662 RepID=UPI00005D5BD2|nr:hypothetical protein [Synechococcus sp. CC9605]ABB35453.1 hypothetical protein Syncc9605_1704 [Synechococcus sp. CC9605]